MPKLITLFWCDSYHRGQLFDSWGPHLPTKGDLPWSLEVRCWTWKIFGGLKFTYLVSTSNLLVLYQSFCVDAAKMLHTVGYLVYRTSKT